MNSSTLQFVVAGALIAAWVWMLGRPILTSAFRRSRRDSVGHFRYQQAVLGQPMVESRAWWSWADRPRPVADWRAQPIERRRLQLMLGFSLATFISLLLAIALRGPFVRLFIMMTVCFVAYLGVAIYIGSTQLRRLEAYQRQVAAAAANRQAAITAVERQNLASSILEDDVPGVTAAVSRHGSADRIGPEDVLEEWVSPEDLELFGQGVFDESFYEPIPELSFRPLNLDASLLQPEDEAVPYQAPAANADPAIEPAAGDVSGRAAAGEDPIAEPGPEIDLADAPDLIADPAAGREGDLADGEPAGPPPGDDEQDPIERQRSEPTFTAPPAQRNRPAKRDKARPIYIESQLDEEEKAAKAVND